MRPLVVALLLPLVASAQQATPAQNADTPKPPVEKRAASPAPYSLPWQLRPAVAANVVRSDSSMAFYEGAAGEPGSTFASMLLISYKVTPQLAPLVRLGMVSNDPPTGENGTSFLNPVLGITWGLKPTEELRLALFLAATLPVGTGGGNTPEPATAAANRAGILARSSMDNAMFAVNDFTVFPGVDLAYVKGGFTAQVEATVLQLTRVKGEEVQADSSRTNFTSGLHLGYFVMPQLSLGAELRYQRWLSTPANVAANEELRDTLSVAFGPRMHFKIGDSVWIRPGLTYSRGLDQPMSRSDYHIVQLDLPVNY